MHLKSQVLMTAEKSMVVFWVVTASCLVGNYHSFSETSVPTYKTTRRPNSENYHRQYGLRLCLTLICRMFYYETISHNYSHPHTAHCKLQKSIRDAG
jgi:hypothetical protein